MTANMKAFTDVEQSKVLAKILPHDTADMWIAEIYDGHVEENGKYVVEDKPWYSISFSKPSENNFSQNVVHDIPCWSLAALLDYLQPNITIEHTEQDGWKVEMYVLAENVEFSLRPQYLLEDLIPIVGVSETNAVDACYDTIIQLDELGLI